MLTLVPDAIEDYARSHSVADHPVRTWLREATYARMQVPQMLSGPLVGQTLKTLTALSGGRLAVEVGTFTGYASSWIAEGLTESGKLITCDVDAECTALGQEAWQKMGQDQQIELRLGPALETLADLSEPIDFVFIDADKANYANYFDLLLPKLRPGGVMVADNVLWSGNVLNPQAPSDHALAAFNEKVAADDRVEQVILSVRDGLNLIRKRS
tara:strand:+ start:440 stop:1078 length:639 start_codon:yes stop_codon:yes gene_type:complete